PLPCHPFRIKHADRIRRLLRLQRTPEESHPCSTHWLQSRLPLRARLSLGRTFPLISPSYGPRISNPSSIPHPSQISHPLMHQNQSGNSRSLTSGQWSTWTSIRTGNICSVRVSKSLTRRSSALFVGFAI